MVYGGESGAELRRGMGGRGGPFCCANGKVPSGLPETPSSPRGQQDLKVRLLLSTVSASRDASVSPGQVQVLCLRAPYTSLSGPRHLPGNRVFSPAHRISRFLFALKPDGT